MFRPGTDQSNVQDSDILCDFCHRPWNGEVPFLEGHRGAMLCGNCLATAYVTLETDAKRESATTDDPSIVTEHYFCRMSRESEEDRAALRRANEPGWRSPIDDEAVISRKFVRMAAATLQKDPDYGWTKPEIATE